MSFKSKSYREIVEHILEDLTVNSQVTDMNIGSVSRTLVESVSREISVLYDQMESAYNAGFIDTADGKSLDMVVSILGLARKSAQFATGTVTFTRHNPSEDVTILRGTRLSTQAGVRSKVKLFETTRTIELPKGEHDVEVPIKALIPGEEGMADFETVTALEVPIIGIDTVMNKKPTTIGTERETDEELRERAKAYIRSTGKVTSEALRSVVMDVPGVRGVTVNEIPNGIPGEVELIIDGLDLSNEETLDHKKVRKAIETVRPAGIHVNIRPTDIIRMDIRLFTKLKEVGSSEDELEAVTNKAKEIISNYIKSLDIGDSLIRNRIISALFKIPEIYNIDNLIITTRKFDTKLGGLIEDTNKRLNPVTQDLEVDEHERLMIDNIAILTQYSLQASSLVYIDLDLIARLTSKSVSIQRIRDQIESVLHMHFDKLEGGEDIDYVRIRNLIANIDGISELNKITISAFHKDTGLIIRNTRDNIKTHENEQPRIRSIELKVE